MESRHGGGHSPREVVLRIRAVLRRLRQKLGAAAESIETVVGVGYRLRSPES